jgi:hypothetical protein
MSISPIRSSGNLPAGKNRDDLKIPTMWTNLFDAALVFPPQSRQGLPVWQKQNLYTHSKLRGALSE